MKVFQVLLTLLGIIVTTDGDPLEKYIRRPGNVYHGRYTRNVHDPELLVPRRVFEDGSFDRYWLPNFYDRREMVARGKRSTETDTDKLHLVLPFNGIEHHVELTPYHDFISPHMAIETRGGGFASDLNEALRFKRAPDQQCHYRGIVRGHHPSRAALSLCDGVVGYVQTNHGRYFIEPAHEAEPQHDGQHVHIAYKRDIPRDPPKKHCGTNDNWEAAWAEQLAMRQKRLIEENPSEATRAASVSFATHSIHRYIEIGLVADRRFLDFYNNSNYEQYLLTIMNMVSDFYHDKSVGNQIDVVVVRMIYLEKEKEEIDLLISPAAEETLDSFAKWAEKMNPKDHTHPNHYDIAVLVTRYDICSEGTNCDLMGLAFVGTACNPEKAACINEDSGLLLGIVIAHEVGHVMGCSHDDVDISGCPPTDKDTSYFVMSPIVFIFTIRWSTCSRKFITTLLESGLGECLNDDPRNPPERFKYPHMLPGAMYDGDFQCRMTFPNSQLCLQAEYQECGSLWCQVNASCLSQGVPMADGTKCGEKKWCIQKKCVDIGTRPTAIHGRWGRWGPMSACSRTCGAGLSYAERECDNPPPSNGGRYCIGERKKLSICNTTPCDPKKPPYRAVQCSSYDNQKVTADGLHRWQPYKASNLDACALYCINENHVFVKLQPLANDSTPCKPGTNDMCVAGTCRIESGGASNRTAAEPVLGYVQSRVSEKVGCDWVLDSNAIEDKCGICKGDGTKCKAVKGVFNDTQVRGPYVKVVTIPKGARSIHVSEMKPNKNLLAVKLEKSGDYCLNGNLSITYDTMRRFTERVQPVYIEQCFNDCSTSQPIGDYECAGSVLLYIRPEVTREEIEIKGPVTEDVRIEYVFYSPRNNPGIRYEYYVMSTDPSYTPKYVWDFMEWSACNAKCGGGTMISEASCIEENGGKVSPAFCEGVPRPDPKSRVCNNDPCPARWRVSQWSKCSACDGKKGSRHRKVQCVRPAARAGEDDVQANLDACKGRVPRQKEECVGQRPCRKSCPKKARNAADERPRVPPEERSKMLDKLVDTSLARYLEKAYGLSREGGEQQADFRQLVREWSIADEDKKKRGVCQRNNLTTPKPGSIIKDSIPIGSVVLMEAPYIEETLRMNLSDRAFQESGDLVGISVDTSHAKIYNGSEAVRMLDKLRGHRNHTFAPRKDNRDAYL